MPLNGSNGTSEGDPRKAAPRPRSSALALVLRASLVVFALIGVLTMLGFVAFAVNLPEEDANFNRRADGIVVLTGGASRIQDAVDLLAAGLGRKLLISGVHRATTSEEIARLVPQYQQWFSCCIDLDRSALNTLGNAIETRRWAKSQNFQSLIIVTSSYHMPRSMMELGRQLPGVSLIPYPVVTERSKTEPWWSGARARILFTEYLKFVAVLARAQIVGENHADAAPTPQPQS